MNIEKKHTTIFSLLMSGCLGSIVMAIILEFNLLGYIAIGFVIMAFCTGLYYARNDRKKFYMNCDICDGKSNYHFWNKNKCVNCQGYGYLQKPNYDELTN